MEVEHEEKRGSVAASCVCGGRSGWEGKVEVVREEPVDVVTNRVGESDWACDAGPFLHRCTLGSTCLSSSTQFVIN